MTALRTCQLPSCGKSFAKRPEEETRAFLAKKYCCADCYRRHEQEKTLAKSAEVKRLKAEGLTLPQVAARMDTSRAQVVRLNNYRPPEERAVRVEGCAQAERIMRALRPHARHQLASITESEIPFLEPEVREAFEEMRRGR